MTIKPEIADIKESFIKELQLRYNISPDEASDKQIYQVLSSIIVEFLKKKRQKFINRYIRTAKAGILSFNGISYGTFAENKSL